MTFAPHSPHPEDAVPQGEVRIARRTIIWGALDRQKPPETFIGELPIWATEPQGTVRYPVELRVLL